MQTPLSPPTVTEVRGEDLPAYISNGLLGLRVLDIPMLPGVTLVNGFAARHPVVEVEAAARAPYPIAGDLRLDGLRLRRFPQQADFVDQAYDFSSGEVSTRFRYSAGGATAHVSVLTLCCRARPTLVLQEVVIRVDTPCDLVMACMMDPLGVHGRMVERHIEMPGAEEAADGSMAWQPVGGSSLCGLAYVTQFQGDADAVRERPDGGEGAPLVTEYSVRAIPGRTYRLRQIASIVPDVLHAQPEHEAMRLVSDAAEIGFDALRDENLSAWRELWRARPVITADDDRWQRLADAAFFYLNSSVHASAPCSTSIYGLAQWDDYHYYYGHVMWDIETFSLPPLILSQPEAARSLLEYRTQTLPAARSNAKLVGRRGLQFPWESGPLHGQEASPGAGSASWFEDHVSPDVALAFAQYIHATGDRRFLDTDGAPVLYGVADWIVSRVSPRARGYEVRRSMGIAERAKPADNDAYTIMVMRRALDEAIGFAEHRGDPVLDSWRRVAAGLSLRSSRTTGAVLSHDGYHPDEEKGATPGPLAGLFPAWYPVEAGVAQTTLDYYLSLADGYVGSPMLSPLYYVWAAWAGDRRLSARLLESGYGDLVAGRFLQTLEMTPSRFPDKPRSGPFFANLGGFLMGLLYGLPGIRLGSGPPGSWPCRPVVLPAGWRSVEVERLWVRGGAATMRAEHGAEKAVIEVASDRPGPGSRSSRPRERRMAAAEPVGAVASATSP